MTRVLGAAARVGMVCAGAFALVVAGQLLLQANAAARPMWTGPNAVVIAHTELQKTQQAIAAGEQQVAGLQAQVQQLSAEADMMGQALAEAEGAFPGFNQAGARTGRQRFRGGDDNGGF